jgi:O-antigen ligase
LAAILIWAIPTVDLTVFGDNNDFRLILDKFSFLADTIRDETFGNDMRFMLFYRGIELIASTLGLGVGIGGISSAMLENSEYYSTDVYVDGRIVGTITDFHNVFLEIAVQYGIIVFLAFVTFLGSLFNFFFKIFSRPIWESSYQVKVYSFLGILCILNIIFTSAISSSVLRTGSFYIFLSSISVIAMSLEFLANHDREYHQSIFSPVPAITFAKN